MSELPQAMSRRELRDRERAAVERVRRSRVHTLGSRILSVSAMLFAAALVVGMSLPANAVRGATPRPTSTAAAASSGNGISTPAQAGSQALAVAPDDDITVGARDSVAVQSWAQVLAEQYSAAGATIGRGSRGAVRWPFAHAVTISSPYGPRVAPCAGCSTFHNGVDFAAAAGSPISAVITGVVTTRDDGSDQGELGNYVIVTGRVGGHKVAVTYAHMAAASSPLVLGQTVKVGSFIGLVGMTGEATGPHLHLGVSVDGVQTDPIPWLEANVR